MESEPDSPLKEEIAKLNGEVRALGEKHAVLRREFEAEESAQARYFRLRDKKKRLEREIAAMEGRPYQDDDEPGYPEAPEPPDEVG